MPDETIFNSRMKIILGSGSSVFPITHQKLSLVVGSVAFLGIMDLILVRFSSPKSLPFFKACTNPTESGQLKVDQVFSEGYSVTDWTFMAAKLSNYMYHFIGLVTTLATALWLRKQEKIIANDNVSVSYS